MGRLSMANRFMTILSNSKSEASRYLKPSLIYPPPSTVTLNLTSQILRRRPGSSTPTTRMVAVAK